MKTGRPEGKVRVPSPCVGKCEIVPSLTDDDRPLCGGCLRTLDEIVRWSEADDDYRRSVWMNIDRRRGDLNR